jgi:DNA-binding transcriptional LysR family regulator
MADEVAELQLFVEIVRAGNLSAAARALNSSPAAMSRGLTALESRLGVRLVTRTSRSFELTEEGQLFYERCARIVADIADAEAEASSKGATIRGMLRLGAPMEIGRRLVAPLITEFREKFPDVQVHLVLSDAGLDVIDDGLDVALRVGLPSDSSVIARKVLTAKAITCASPSYFKELGTPAKPGDLLQHDCIRLVRGRRVMDAWVFQEQGKRFEVVVNGTLTTTSGEVVHDWVRAGKGIARKADWDLQAELREGSIVPCLSDYWCEEIDLFAICANRRHLSPRIRAFLKFIVARLPEAVTATDHVPRKLRVREPDLALPITQSCCAIKGSFPVTYDHSNGVGRR